MPKDTFFNLPQDKRQVILDLALEEFAANDYRNASISRVVARAGIAKGSFYQYFEDKQDLYLYLLDLAVQEKLSFLRQLGPAPEATGIFDRLRWLLRAGVGFQFSNPRLAHLTYRAVFDDAPLPEETQALITAGSRPYYRQLVEEGIDRGDIDPAADPDLAAFMFEAVFGQLGNYLLERMAIDPMTLLEEGAVVFEDQAVQSIFDGVVTLLERGMASAATGDPVELIDDDRRD